MTLSKKTIAQMKAGLAAKEFSATELVQDSLAAIDASKDLNAFISSTPETALESAKQAMRKSPKASPVRWKASPSASKICSAHRA